jgi:hypothetical protein
MGAERGGATSGKHFFQVSVSGGDMSGSYVMVGWVDRALTTDASESGPGNASLRFRLGDYSAASGATFMPFGSFHFGTAPLSRVQYKEVQLVKCPCTVGCMLDVDAGAMTVFVDGVRLDEQCEYTFPTDREWAPSVGLRFETDTLFSNAV